MLPHALDAGLFVRPSGMHYLICLDFDGTLAPIVPNPDSAAPSATCLKALIHLAESRIATTTVAVISGRSVEKLRKLMGANLAAAPRIVWAGAHGAEADAGAVGGVASWCAPQGANAALAAVAAALRLALARDAAPGAVLEDNGAALSLHYRGCSDGGVLAAAAVDGALALTQPLEEEQSQLQHERKPLILERRGGHLVHEVRLRGDGKGRALERIARDVLVNIDGGGDRRSGGGSFGSVPALAIVVIGDDLTDEAMFEAALALEREGVARALPVVVAGEGGIEALGRPTAARAWLRSPSEVCEALQQLAG